MTQAIDFVKIEQHSCVAAAKRILFYTAATQLIIGLLNTYGLRHRLRCVTAMRFLYLYYKA